MDPRQVQVAQLQVIERLNQSIAYLQLLIVIELVDATESTTTGGVTSTTTDTSVTDTTTTSSSGSTCSSERYDYGEVLELSNLFYEAQRSGALPPDNRVEWRGNSSLGDKGHAGEDLTGGYHDGRIVNKIKII